MGSGTRSNSAIASGSRAGRLGSHPVRVAVACVLAAAVAVAAAIGLGTGSSPAKVASVPVGSRAAGRSRPQRRPAAAAGAVHGARRPARIPAGAYGYIPAWLPQSKVPVGRVVAATPAHPSLAIQGDTVKVDLGHVQVLATASGPATPEQGRFPVPRTSPCTFTITFAAASGVVPLKRADFATIDELGAIHALRVTAGGGGPVPANVVPGQTVTLTMSAVLPTGEGRLMWTPLAGRPIVQWDFDVEID